MSGLVELRLLLAVFGAWVGRREARIIAYLIEENRVLKEQLTARGKRLRLTNDQRRRLAAKGKPLGRRTLQRIATIVTPDTILAWHRKLIAAKWTFTSGRLGRPGVARLIRSLIVRMAKDNPRWGYTKIQGALKHLDHKVGRDTIATVLKEHGIPPCPDRSMSWSTFIRSHRHAIAAADFFLNEVWTPRGLVRHYTFFVIDISTRAVQIAGTTTNPTAEWMQQIARNLTDCTNGFLRGKRYLILDRDCLYGPGFVNTLAAADVKVVRTAYRSPNMNAYAERFVRSIRFECLDQMIFVGRASLDRALREFEEHYNTERPHQGVGNELIHGRKVPRTGRIRVRERLGGVLKYYHRKAVA